MAFEFSNMYVLGKGDTLFAKLKFNDRNHPLYGVNTLGMFVRDVPGTTGESVLQEEWDNVVRNRIPDFALGFLNTESIDILIENLENFKQMIEDSEV